MADDVTAPAGWLNGLSADDDSLSYARKLAAAMQQRMRGQSLSAAAPDGPVPDDAASFADRFGSFGSLSPPANNVPLPQPRPASAPGGNALDNLYHERARCAAANSCRRSDCSD